MSFSVNLLGILLALTSAIVWGGGDFSGGLATRKSNQFQVLALSAFPGIILLIIFAILWHEAIPAPLSIVYAMLAGTLGSIGIAALYYALSLGFTASVAPISAVIAAILPVGFNALTQGLPTAIQMAGFILAFAGIWFVSQAPTDEDAVSRKGFWLACLAGTGFGSFFILIALVEPGKIFTPLIISRMMALLVGIIMLRMNRLKFPSLSSNPIALFAGVLDAGGNVFYILAKQFTRLDIAAVLSSMYPATTVFLAGIVLKEKISQSQWIGVLTCLAAIVLITI
jgi:drug/metabolite transporter (DMT)-like permease